MSLLGEERAQASIEMLLLVAGAIAVAAIVGVLLKRSAEQLQERAGEEAGKATGAQQ